MALIFCPNCGKQISSRLDKCPVCGFPLNETQESSTDVDATKIPDAELQASQPSSNDIDEAKTSDNHNENKPSGIKKRNTILIAIIIVLMLPLFVIKIINMRPHQKVTMDEEHVEMPNFPPVNTQDKEPIPSTVTDEEAWAFIRDMYNNERYENYDFLKKYCSPNLLKKLKDNFEYEGDGYAVWDFRSGYQDGNSNVHTLVNVSSRDGDGWFVYQGIDMGWLFYRSVQLSKKNGEIRIEDIYLGDILEKNSNTSSSDSNKEMKGIIPESIPLNPTVAGPDFLKVLGFEDVDDEYEAHNIEKDLVNQDHTKQILSIYTWDGARSWYNLYFIDLVNRSYSLFGSYFSIKFDSSFFTTVKRTPEIVNEDMDMGILRTEDVYNYNGELLRSVSELSTDPDDYFF